ncbi:MAG: hypothetical protein ACLRQF_11135 [Thomasclavelia ramosa]
MIEVIHEEAKEFPAGYTIIASGPLTSDALATAIKEKLGEDYFYFLMQQHQSLQKKALILQLRIINLATIKGIMNILIVL